MKRWHGAVLLSLVAVSLCPIAPGVRAQVVDRFRLSWTQESGWGVYCRLDVSGSRQGAGRARLLCHTPPGTAAATGRVAVSVDAEMNPLPASDVERLIDLVGRADLFGGRHAGGDARGGDGMFNTLQVWVNSPGRTVVLVTSQNPSFTGGDEPRTRLLQALACLEERLRVQAGRAPNPSRSHCDRAPE